MKKSMEFTLTAEADSLEELKKKSNQALKTCDYPESTIQSQMKIIDALVASANQFDNLKPSDIGMAVRLLLDKDTITVEVKKTVCESANGKLNQLDKAIQWVRGNLDTLDAYGRPHAVEANGFGLTAIAHEAGAVIDFYVSEDNILNLSAVCNLVT